MKVFLFAALLLIMTIGCNRSVITTASVPTSTTSTVSVPTASFKETAEDDKAVFSVVLTHFAKQEVAGNASAEGVKKVIVIDSKSNGPSFYISEDQLNGEFHNESWQLPVDLRAKLRERNRQAITVDTIIHGENLVVDDLSKLPKDIENFEVFEKKHPQAIRYVELWLPAYSQDGRHALVRFSFGPTAHGATATYLLVKENGVWAVKHHKIAYYV